MGKCTNLLIVALLLISQFAMILITVATVAIVFARIAMRTAWVAMRITRVAWLIVEMRKFCVVMQRPEILHLRAEAGAGEAHGQIAALFTAIDHWCAH
jgi:hypothetical protein